MIFELLLIVGLGGIAYWAGRTAWDAINARLDSIGASAKSAYDYVTSIPDRVVASTGQAVDSLKTQATQTSRERAGEHLGSGLEVHAQIESQKARDALAQQQSKQPVDARVAKLKQQLATIEQSGSAGIFDGDVFLTKQDLEKQLADLGASPDKPKEPPPKPSSGSPFMDMINANMSPAGAT